MAERVERQGVICKCVREWRAAFCKIATDCLLSVRCRSDGCKSRMADTPSPVTTNSDFYRSREVEIISRSLYHRTTIAVVRTSAGDTSLLLLPYRAGPALTITAVKSPYTPLKASASEAIAVAVEPFNQSEEGFTLERITIRPLIPNNCERPRKQGTCCKQLLVHTHTYTC